MDDRPHKNLSLPNCMHMLADRCTDLRVYTMKPCLFIMPICWVPEPRSRALQLRRFAIRQL